MVIIDRGNDNIDLKCGRFGFTIPGAANAISETYAVPEPEIRCKIIEAVCSGDLRIRNQYGYPYQSGNVDMQNDRISVEDLNTYHSERGICAGETGVLSMKVIAEIQRRHLVSKESNRTHCSWIAATSARRTW